MLNFVNKNKNVKKLKKTVSDEELAYLFIKSARSEFSTHQCHLGVCGKIRPHRLER